MKELIAQLCNSKVPILDQLSLDPPDSAFSTANHGTETRQRITTASDDVFLYSNWVQGKRSGRAFVKDKDNNMLINMRFVDGLLEGTMIMTDDTCQLIISYNRNSPTGDVKVIMDMDIEFKGKFKNGMANGMCEQHFPNGKYFHGNYLNGVASGVGSLCSEDGSKLLSGEWENGELNSVSVRYPRVIAFIQSFTPVSNASKPKEVARVYLNNSGIKNSCEYYEKRKDRFVFQELKRVFSQTDSAILQDEDRKRRMDLYMSWTLSMEAYIAVRDAALKKYNSIRYAAEMEERKRAEEAQRKKEEAQRKKAEEEQKRMQEEWKRRQEEEWKRMAEEEWKRRQEEEQKRLEEEERKRMEQEQLAAQKLQKSTTNQTGKARRKKKRARAKAKAKPVATPQIPVPVASQEMYDSSSSEEDGEGMGRTRGKLAAELKRQTVEYNLADEDIANLESAHVVATSKSKRKQKKWIVCFTKRSRKDQHYRNTSSTPPSSPYLQDCFPPPIPASSRPSLPSSLVRKWLVAVLRHILSRLFAAFLYPPAAEIWRWSLQGLLADEELAQTQIQ